MNETVGEIVEKIVGSYDWNRLSQEAKKSKCEILSKYIEEGNTNNDKIVDFLNEVQEQDWELDADDIKHILNLDFKYVRDENTD